MKKITYLSLLLSAVILTNCGGNEATTSQDVTQEETDTISAEDTLLVDTVAVQIPLFDMHPEVVLESIDGFNEVYFPTIHYYAGEVDGQSVAMTLLQDNYYTNSFSGQVFNKSLGATFSIQGKVESTSDTIRMKSLTDSSHLQTISGVFDYSSDTFSGFWVKDGKKALFTLTKADATPEQRALFVDLLDYSSLVNTDAGLVSEEKGNFSFNDFIYRSSDGEGYDFSSLSIEKEFFIHFPEDGLVFTEVTVEVEEGTTFKEGHGPSGIDDTDYIVEGEYMSSYLIVSYQWLKNGVLIKGSFDLSEEGALTSWSFKDKLVVMIQSSRADNPSVMAIYSWDNDLKEYVKS